MSNTSTCNAFDFWVATHNAPYHFPMDVSIWESSMQEDTDSDGRKLFDNLIFRYSRANDSMHGEYNGMIVYGTTDFGFAPDGEISGQVHHKVIRDFCFDPASVQVGQDLLDMALADLGREEQIYAFFHYFGMSACARHGKLHESQGHIHDMLLKNGFVVEHENVYYSKSLTAQDLPEARIQIVWRERNAGSCQEFAAKADGDEIGWGQVHFLPQGDIAYLRWIYIDEKRQHQGIGSATMRQLFAQLRQMGISRLDTDTAMTNTVAQKYYEKTGFTHCGITRSYFTK